MFESDAAGEQLLIFEIEFVACGGRVVRFVSDGRCVQLGEQRAIVVKPRHDRCAIRREGAATTVWRVKDGRIAKAVVQLGARDERSMHIVHITAEMAPCAKVCAL